MMEKRSELTTTPTAILICGRIASGKTVYAKKLCEKQRAVSLSCDELMLTVFGDTLGARFDEVSGRCKRYLYEKAIELLGVGTNVVLDWGFWSSQERRYARRVFEEAGYACKMHYVHVSNDVWRKNIAMRNKLVREGRCNAYPVDEGLIRKLEAGFCEPTADEIDVFYENDWC